MTKHSSLIQLHGISKKSDELRRTHLLKESGLIDVTKNNAPTYIVKVANVELGKQTKRILGEYVERTKLPGEVKAAELSIWDRTTYRTGDGDHTAQVPRAGSLQAFTLPSRGNRT
jgi:hypothetical protein